jgi:hypothetical protein
MFCKTATFALLLIGASSASIFGEELEFYFFSKPKLFRTSDFQPSYGGGRIVNGTDAPAGKYPSQVFILLNFYCFQF